MTRAGARGGGKGPAARLLRAPLRPEPVPASDMQAMALLDEGKPLLRNAFTDRAVLGGGETFFYPEVSGALPLQFQWRFYGTNLPGATSRVLHLANISMSQAGPYSVRISNAHGETTSPEGWLTVAPFRILAQPSDWFHYAGGSCTFSVGVEGTAFATLPFRRATSHGPEP